MWSTDSWWSRFVTFGASLSLRGRIEKVSAAIVRLCFKHQFHGGLYRLLDIVLDVPSVVKALSENARGRIFKLKRDQSHWQRNSQGQPSCS